MGSGMGFCTLLVIKGVPPFTVIDASLSMRLTASSVIVTWNETRTVSPGCTSPAFHTMESVPSTFWWTPSTARSVPSAAVTVPSGRPGTAPSSSAPT